MTAAGDMPPTDRLDELFRAHHDRVLAYAVRRVGPEAAPDVAAETFAVALRRHDAVPAGAELPWLLATARNLVLAHVRTAARRAEIEDRAAALDRAVRRDQPDPSDATADRLLVRRALDRLAEPDRELMLLVAWDDLRPAEAALVLGCSVGAVRVRWFRARRRFADALAAEDDEWAGRRTPAPAPAPTPTTVTLGGRP
jgi:RNA polymerase sigma-70 factor (ECF subfamily)